LKGTFVRADSEIAAIETARTVLIHAAIFWSAIISLESYRGKGDTVSAKGEMIRVG
jgi:hypothetical protein